MAEKSGEITVLGKKGLFRLGSPLHDSVYFPDLGKDCRVLIEMFEFMSALIITLNKSIPTGVKAYYLRTLGGKTFNVVT